MWNDTSSMQNGLGGTAMRLRLLLTAALCITWSSVETAAVERKAQTVTTCALASQCSCDGQPPQWTDPRLGQGQEGRAAIVRDAATRACKKLVHLDNASNIFRAFHLSSGPRLREEDCVASLVNDQKTFTVRTVYTPARRSDDVAAGVTTSYSYYTKSIEFYGGDCNEENNRAFPSVYWTPADGEIKINSEHYANVCYREELYATVEVFPVMFATSIEVSPGKYTAGAFCICSERRWARDPVEAVMYAILHEFGHLESHIGDLSNYRILDVAGRATASMREWGNSENDAWGYASDAMRSNR